MKNTSVMPILIVLTILFTLSLTTYPVEEINVPLSAVKDARYSQLSADQLTEENVYVPKSWIKEEWLEKTEPTSRNRRRKTNTGRRNGSSNPNRALLKTGWVIRSILMFRGSG